MKKMILRIYIILFLGGLVPKIHFLYAEEEAFHWTKEKTEFADIAVQVAGPGTIQNTIQVSGKIVTHPDYFAYVISKVSGCVFEVRKSVGDLVEKGDVLALVESKEIAEAKASYLAAQKQYQLYQTLWNKEKILQGISSEAEYLKSEWEAQESDINLQLAIQNLFSLGFTNQEISQIERGDAQNMRFYAVKAPLKGKILERNFTLGELIDPTTKAFTIGDFKTVCVEINVPQNDVQYLKAGLPVELNACGKTATVKLSQFNPLISEETRMATAIALMDNDAEKWCPGEFITATIQIDIANAAIIVPLSALQIIKGENCVFVEDGQAFTPHVVKLGKMDNQNAEVLSGLAAGMVFAAQNTFTLKAEFEKEEGEHSH